MVTEPSIGNQHFKKESTARCLFTFLIHCCQYWFRPTSPPTHAYTGSGYDYRQCVYSSIYYWRWCLCALVSISDVTLKPHKGRRLRQSTMWHTDSIPASGQIQGQNTHTLNQYAMRSLTISLAAITILFYWDSHQNLHLCCMSHFRCTINLWIATHKHGQPQKFALVYSLNCSLQASPFKLTVPFCHLVWIQTWLTLIPPLNQHHVRMSQVWALLSWMSIVVLPVRVWVCDCVWVDSLVLPVPNTPDTTKDTLILVEEDKSCHLTCHEKVYIDY